MSLRRTSWTLAALLAAWVAYHLSVYRYSYEPLGTNSFSGARNEIVSIDRATGTACIWRWRRGWTCVDAETYERAKHEGVNTLPAGPPYSLREPRTGLR